MMDKDAVIFRLGGLVSELIHGATEPEPRIINRITTLENHIMATVTEFKEQVLAALEGVKAVAVAEKQQVVDAVAALSAQIQALQDQISAGDVIPADALTEVQASIADLSTLVAGIQE